MSASILTGVAGSILGAKLFKSRDVKSKLSLWLVLLLVLLAPLITLNAYTAITGFILSQLCISAMNVIFMSFRQEVIPTEFIGGANAFIRMLLLGVVPISSIVLTSFAESKLISFVGILMVILISLSIVTLNFGNIREKKKFVS